MLVLGGKAKGGKVYGRWSGLDNEQLNQRRSLALTTDFRVVPSGVVTKTIGREKMKLTSPDDSLAQSNFLNFARVVPLILRATRLSDLP